MDVTSNVSQAILTDIANAVIGRPWGGTDDDISYAQFCLDTPNGISDFQHTLNAMLVKNYNALGDYFISTELAPIQGRMFIIALNVVKVLQS